MRTSEIAFIILDTLKIERLDSKLSFVGGSIPLGLNMRAKIPKLHLCLEGREL
jgi:hypothetical protein